MSALRLYDTATRSVRDFVPREPGKVGIYLCGVTVQSEPHIGHMRSAVNYDVLRRWLEHRGLAVRLIRNITDIDDKVLAKAMAAGVPFWSIAYRNERLLERMYDRLGVAAPSYEPHATAHIPEIVALIERLIARGHAYVADPIPGPTPDSLVPRELVAGRDVYFDVGSYPEYGALTGQNPAAMLPSEEGGSSGGKRSPLDFALWKAEKPTEPADAYWPSPWGRGRPGWHIECSAMTWRYLGEEFDIHGGGLEIAFPHHENELAQSRAAGFAFARYWVHNAMLNLAGEKMSKSVGNILTLDGLLARGIRPVEARYYLATPHYRSTIEYTDAALAESAAGYRRIEGFVERASERLGEVPPGEPAPEFAAAMDDDLNTSRAVAVVHDVVRAGNAALADGDAEQARAALATVRGMLGVLGLDPLAEPWLDRSATDLRPTVDRLVRLALERREAARAGKDWAAADAVRDQLKNAGVVIEDTPDGPRWTLMDGTT